MRIYARQSLQKPLQGPLGLVEMELEVGGSEGLEESFSAPSFSHQIRLRLLNPNIV